MKIYGIWHQDEDEYYDNGNFFYYFLSKEKAEAFLVEVSTPPPIPENWMELYEAEKSKRYEELKVGLLNRQEAARKRIEETEKGRQTIISKMYSDEFDHATLAEKLEDQKFYFPTPEGWLKIQYAPKYERKNLSINEVDVIE